MGQESRSAARAARSKLKDSLEGIMLGLGRLQALGNLMLARGEHRAGLIRGATPQPNYPDLSYFIEDLTEEAVSGFDQGEDERVRARLVEVKGLAGLLSMEGKGFLAEDEHWELVGGLVHDLAGRLHDLAESAWDAGPTIIVLPGASRGSSMAGREQTAEAAACPR